MYMKLFEWKLPKPTYLPTLSIKDLRIVDFSWSGGIDQEPSDEEVREVSEKNFQKNFN